MFGNDRISTGRHCYSDISGDIKLHDNGKLKRGHFPCRVGIYMTGEEFMRYTPWYHNNDPSLINCYKAKTSKSGLFPAYQNNAYSPSLRCCWIDCVKPNYESLL